MINVNGWRVTVVKRTSLQDDPPLKVWFCWTGFPLLGTLRGLTLKIRYFCCGLRAFVLFYGSVSTLACGELENWTDVHQHSLKEASVHACGWHSIGLKLSYIVRNVSFHCFLRYLWKWNYESFTFISKVCIVKLGGENTRNPGSILAGVFVWSLGLKRLYLKIISVQKHERFFDVHFVNCNNKELR